MSLTECAKALLRSLASVAFSDRLDLVALSGWSRGAVYGGIRELEAAALVASVPHATDLLPPTRRYRLTADSLRLLATEEGTTVEQQRDSRCRFRRTRGQLSRTPLTGSIAVLEPLFSLVEQTERDLSGLVLSLGMVMLFLLCGVGPSALLPRTTQQNSEDDQPADCISCLRLQDVLCSSLLRCHDVDICP